ncbi:site-specific DNA-methyltransferase [Mesorhizobium sp. C120A]|uniref:DNA methyltransferase n=1 Tax=unclassified Mesorhizobium TaxID=325217 RepID=UPI0003F9A2C1|nr:MULTISPECIES: DNA methyltransferase [unclassified Mesorhizobium]WJI45063.1 site-specific DNA-methyltransferase [Mesorhizobium sp. C120A]
MNASTEFLDGRITLLSGDCFARLDDIPEGSVDAVVCDPPYHLTSIVNRFGAEDAAPATPKEGSAGAYARASAGFMGKTWDGGDIAFRPDLWAKVLRVLKPGGYVVAFSGTRTYHDMAVAIARAGFEVRDNILNMLASDTAVVQFLGSLSPAQVEAFFRCIEDSQFGGMLAWCYGTGFPKSHSVSKGIDDHLFRQWLDENPAIRVRHDRLIKWAKSRDKRGVSTGLRGRIETAFKRLGDFRGQFIGKETLVNDMRNSALLNVGKGEERPAYDRDIYSTGTPEAAEWEGWGTALKPAWEPICLARKPMISTVAANTLAHGTGGLNVDACRIDAEKATGWGGKASGGGTWTDENSGLCKDGAARPVQGRYPANIITDGSAEVEAAFPDANGAQGRVSGQEASASTKNTHGEYKRAASEPRGDAGSAVRFFYSAKADGDDRLGSKHPTVKPVDLMRWLVRLVCRKGGTVLDPFAGTGTAGEAAFWEGCNAILIEREEEYQRDIAKRMSLVLAGPETKKRARTEIEPAEGLPLFGEDTVAHVSKINAREKLFA